MGKSNGILKPIYKKLIKFRPKDPLYELQDKQYDLFSDWHHIAIRELVNTIEFQEDPQWIAAQLDPPITPASARFISGSAIR